MPCVLWRSISRVGAISSTMWSESWATLMSSRFACSTSFTPGSCTRI